MERGSRIGDWIVDSALGKGGMGSVYLCHNAMSDRLRAAVKVVEHARPEDRERFVREVEAIDRVRHPFVVGIKGWGEDGDRLWLAMEWVDGEDLKTRLERGPLDEAAALELIEGLAGALGAAHARGVSHRDVKPANIVLSKDGARLVDFGIARHQDLTRLTAEGLVAGTPAYLAPEAFTGVPEPVALDVYALGLVLYETLTGEAAFPAIPGLSSGHQIARLVSQKNESRPFDPGPEFSDRSRECVRRATSPHPASRLASMHELLAVLQGEAPAQGGETFFVDAGPPPVVSSPTLDLEQPALRPSEAPSRAVSPAMWAAGLGLVAVGLVAIGWGLGTGSTAPPSAAEEPVPPRLGKVKVQAVTVDGVLDTGHFGDVIRANKRSLTRCYDEALASEPGLAGEMSIRFTVQPSGQVTDLQVDQPLAESEPLTRCAANAIGNMIFRTGANTVEIGLLFVRR